jgi:hypothetical protein
MLEKLLSEIRAGGTFESGDLASRLGTTPEMLSAMLEHLQRSGHLQPFNTCSDACAECNLSNSCTRPQSATSSGQTLRLYTLTGS